MEMRGQALKHWTADQEAASSPTGMAQLGLFSSPSFIIDTACVCYVLLPPEGFTPMVANEGLQKAKA